MNYCKYSIIPTPKGDIYCSSCGKKLEGLPHYPQVMQLFLNIKRSAFEFQYVGLGLGVPMCRDCHDDITMQIEEKHNDTGTIILFVAAMIFLWVIGKVSDLDIRYFSIPILGGLVFYIYYRNKTKYKESNELIRNKGLDKIDSAINRLEKNGWRQDMGTTLCKVYSPEALKLELDGICQGGRYRLIDTETGYSVDYHDPETLKNIYKESIIIEEKDYDGDFDGD